MKTKRVRDYTRFARGNLLNEGADISLCNRLPRSIAKKDRRKDNTHNDGVEEDRPDIISEGTIVQRIGRFQNDTKYSCQNSPQGVGAKEGGKNHVRQSKMDHHKNKKQSLFIGRWINHPAGWMDAVQKASCQFFFLISLYINNFVYQQLSALGVRNDCADSSIRKIIIIK